MQQARPSGNPSAPRAVQSAREAWMRSLGYPRHGLRITIRLRETVVGQRVLWAPPVAELLGGGLVLTLLSFLLTLVVRADLELLGLPSFAWQLLLLVLAPAGAAMALAALVWPRRQRLGASVDDAVPTEDGLHLAEVHWRPGVPPRLSPQGAAAEAQAMPPGSSWRWSRGDVQVDVRAQERETASRWALDPGGDLGLLVVILTLAVGLAQLTALGQAIFATSVAPTSMAPSPELIARLLQKDLEGEEQAAPERVERPEHQRQSGELYMPAGNNGPLVRTGGGAELGAETRRTDPVQEPEAVAAVEADEPREALAEASPPPPPELLEPQPGERPAAVPEREAEPSRDEAQARQGPIERFIGWGFRDWLDASPRRDELDPRVERDLMLARARLRLDPDDPAALQVLGHYAYLAENLELSEASFRRLTELDPEDAASLNNLALTHKRRGAYLEEEALYRKALQYAPDDVVVLNNLAVNLAHQGRFDEALQLMARLEELDPDDPYSELHRAKVYSAMGKRDRAFKHLRKALDGLDRLSTLHHVEFRQDLRLEPLLDELRDEPRYARILRQVYGAEAEELLRPARRGARG